MWLEPAIEKIVLSLMRKYKSRRVSEVISCNSLLFSFSFSRSTSNSHQLVLPHRRNHAAHCWNYYTSNSVISLMKRWFEFNLGNLHKKFNNVFKFWVLLYCASTLAHNNKEKEEIVFILSSFLCRNHMPLPSFFLWATTAVGWGPVPWSVPPGHTTLEWCPPGHC